MHEWQALPYTYPSSPAYFMEFDIAANQVTVNWYYNGSGLGTDPNTIFNFTPLNPMPFKIVVIPQRLKNSHPNLNYNNYEEVKKAFNLKD